MSGRCGSRIAHGVVLALAALLVVQAADSRVLAGEDEAIARLSRFARGIAERDPAVRSLRQRALVTTRVGGQEATITQTVEIVFPDRIRRTTVVDGTEQVLVVNGGSGYIGLGEQRMPLPDSLFSQTSEELRNDLLVLAAAVGRPGVEAHAVDDPPDGDASCRVVEVSNQGARSRLCLAEDGTVLWQALRGRDPLTGAPGTTTVWFSDYRDVAGVRYPFRNVVSVDGQALAAVQVTSLEINPDLPDSLFVVPPPE